MQQPALSYIRDVLSLVINPSLAEKSKKAFKPDVIERAQKYLKALPDVGAYTESQGIGAVRDEVCQFLLERDGFKADPNNIFLTNGASEGVRLCMQTIMRYSLTHSSLTHTLTYFLLRDPSSGFMDGVLTPIPQYPLYSALSTLLQAKLVPYYLDESNGWNCTPKMLSQALKKAKNEGITPRALVVINPGNPTGQILPAKTMKGIVEWCVDEKICLMADEVYQENIWKSRAKFTSFRKVAYEMNAITGDADSLQLISFHSISKGFLGECGLRGGYFELLGLPADVKAEIYKLASISLCSNTIGQIATGIMVQPPKKGETSFKLYNKEKTDILESLNRRAQKLSEALNALPGVSCNTIDGAMYAFPTVKLPLNAIETAIKNKMEPDALYCSELLEATGIVVVPGSGFGQVQGTYHFRTTILPSEEKIDQVIEKLTHFHNSFLAKYGGL